MNLITPELRRAIERAGDRPVEITDPETDIVYVLVRAEVFKQLHSLKGYGDGPLTIEEQKRLLGHAGEIAGWDDPALDVYNELNPRRPGTSCL